MNSKKYILLTIDVEDWFQVENFKPWIPFESWEHRQLRVEKNIHRLLDLFDSFEVSQTAGGMASRSTSYQSAVSDDLKGNGQLKPDPEHLKKVKGTFFVLGWIAERLPHMVREIHSRGHEVASHGCNHILPNQQSPSELKKDLTDSKKILEDLIGSEIFGLRAPSFAVNDEALRMIEHFGYRYDSSYNSFSAHGRYGKISLNGFSKRGIAHKITENFYELPVSNLDFLKDFSYARILEFFVTDKNPDSNKELSPLRPAHDDKKRFVMPWGGGAYFRIMPFSIFKLGVERILKIQQAYLFYIHPWELDPDQPKLAKASSINKFRHYFNISKTRKRLEHLIKGFSDNYFITCKSYLDMMDHSTHVADK